MKTSYSKYCLFLSLLLLSINLLAQDVYKTPSGKKYHLSTCRMVENVSQKITIENAISLYELGACKICKPPVHQRYLNSLSSSSNKAVGQEESVQCVGYTLRGTRCKHRTRLANGYCYQHTKQNSQQSKTSNYNTLHLGSSSTSPKKSYSGRCGGRTKSGGACKRKVKGGGYCYQHR